MNSTQNQTPTPACPECGSLDLDANTWEAWCSDCARQWTEAAEPEVYTLIRAAALDHREAIAKRLGLD